MWDVRNEDSGARRKISGHPGAAASLYVSETLGQYDIRGTLRCYYGGMSREAGSGGHGIDEGTILVAVEIKPMNGMNQLFDVPVQVKNGYMLQPGMFLNHGVPYVMAQSSIDDLMSAGSFEPEITPDRKNMFSPPQTRSANMEAVAERPKPVQTREEYESLKQKQETGQSAEEAAAAKAKARRKQRVQEGAQPRVLGALEDSHGLDEKPGYTCPTCKRHNPDVYQSNHGEAQHETGCAVGDRVCRDRKMKLNPNWSQDSRSYLNRPKKRPE